MKLLLVEDDENKSVQLTRFIEEVYPDAALQATRSLQAGVRCIRRETYDLVLLDMTLPNYDAGPDEPGGGITHSFGGREFLKQMDRFEIKTPVIVVTQFEKFGVPPDTLDLPELDAQLRQQHGRVYFGSVYYNASIHGWREMLRDLCDSALGRNIGVS